uniref:Uncharacterized protein n=2 Tax=Hemiselmis andersenii TaxID=464988 RepID=A0A6U4ZDZ7_HEMAN|mmetsp:Transcript_31034/g.72563  ORF Transcript_31034/g.72563 Transcript_31034/m.72563 type:complete len:117 (+) Transcript_31034:249-599(+)
MPPAGGKGAGVSVKNVTQAPRFQNVGRHKHTEQRARVHRFRELEGFTDHMPAANQTIRDAWMEKRIWRYKEDASVRRILKRSGSSNSRIAPGPDEGEEGGMMGSQGLFQESWSPKR